MPTIKQLWTDYQEYLTHERGLAPRTIDSYRRDLLDLADYVGVRTDVKDITLDILRTYQRTMSMKGLKSATVRKRLHGFTTFWRWLELENYVDEVIPKRLRIPRKKRKIARWMTEEELKTFVLTPATGKTEATRLRNGLAWKTLAWLGIRRGELLNLKIQDVDIDAEQIILRNTKGNHERALLIPEAILPDFIRIIEGHHPDAYVFRGWDGRQWKVRAFQRAIATHLKNCGLANCGISAHTLRHSFATHLVKRGVNIAVVKEMLGHQDINTTMIYTHIDKLQIRHSMQLHPLNE